MVIEYAITITFILAREVFCVSFIAMITEYKVTDTDDF